MCFSEEVTILWRVYKAVFKFHTEKYCSNSQLSNKITKAKPVKTLQKPNIAKHFHFG